MLDSSSEDISEQWSQNPHSALTEDKHIISVDKTRVRHKKQAPHTAD